MFPFQQLTAQAFVDYVACQPKESTTILRRKVLAFGKSQT